MTIRVAMTVNGTEYARDVEPRLLLIHFIRDELGLTGSHWGCDTSNCGSCVVWLDAKPVKSCTLLAAMADGHAVRTVEGLERDGRLDPVQQGFVECHGLQCGFCTPGMMMTARWLLDRHPDPDEAEIREAISGQICRCTGYENIVRSIRWAAEHPTGQLMTGGFGRMRRKEDQRFIRGQGCYVDDVQLPGMLYGAVLRSPHPHARILGHRHPGRRGPPEGPRGHHRRDSAASGTWPGCPPCPGTGRPCWPPTRCGSRDRKWRSWWPRTATRRGTPWS